MQLGIFAKTFPGRDPDTVLKAAKESGYSAVQYNMACSGVDALPVAIERARAEAVGKAARRWGVTIAAVSATYNMIHPSLDHRRRGRLAVAAIAEAAGAMGARVLTLCTGSADSSDQWRYHPENDSPDSWRALLQEFDHLVPIAERYELVLGVEPELANVVSSHFRARELLDTLKTDHVGIVLDPANLAEVADSAQRRKVVEEAIDLLDGRIVLAHAKDRHANGAVASVGKGEIDFRHFFSRLRGGGFDGPVIAHGFEEADAAGVASFLNRFVPQPYGATSVSRPR
jgi:sugar phosphate isomerase/epimerase